MTKRPIAFSLLVGALALFALAGCSGTQQHTRHAQPAPAIDALASLPEPTALALIDRWLQEQKLTAREGWAVELPEQAHPIDIPVDIRLGGARIGIEWISEADRLRFGPVLPAPDPSGQLRVVQAKDGALVLLLDQESYRYERSGTRALLASRDLASTEDRLKHDVEDFIAYLKSQYAL